MDKLDELVTALSGTFMSSDAACQFGLLSLPKTLQDQLLTTGYLSSEDRDKYIKIFVPNALLADFLLNQSSDTPPNKTILALKNYLKDEIYRLNEEGKAPEEIVEIIRAFNSSKREKQIIETEITELLSDFDKKYTAEYEKIKQQLPNFINTPHILASLSQNLLFLSQKIDELNKNEDVTQMSKALALQLLAEKISENDSQIQEQPTKTLQEILDLTGFIEQFSELNDRLNNIQIQIEAEKKQPLYRIRQIASGQISVDLVQTFLSEREINGQIKKRQEEISSLELNITNSQQAVSDLQAELEAQTKMIAEIRARMKIIRQEEAIAKREIKSGESQVKELFVKLICLEGRAERKSKVSLISATTISNTPPPRQNSFSEKSSQTPEICNHESELLSQNSSQTTNLSKEQQTKIDDIIRTAANPIYQELSVADVFEILYAGSQNQLGNDDFNTLWSYFILHDGDIEKMRQDFNFIPKLKNLLDCYFPQVIVDDKIFAQQISENNIQNADILAAIEKIGNRKIALLCSNSTPITGAFIEKVKKIIGQNGGNAEIIHLCSSKAASVRQLFNNGKIDLAVIHYSFCRPSQIEELRKACEFGEKGSQMDKIPFLLIPYNTGSQATLHFIANHIGVIK